MKFQYKIYPVDVPNKVVFDSGTVWGLTVDQALIKLEKKFKKDVLENGVKIAVSLSRKSECVFTQRYEMRHDFRKARMADFRRRLGLKLNGNEPILRYWFIAVSKTGELIPTKLCHDLSERTWLSSRKKKLLGPFVNFEAVDMVIKDVEQIRSLTSKLHIFDWRDYARGRSTRKGRLYKKHDIGRVTWNSAGVVS